MYVLVVVGSSMSVYAVNLLLRVPVKKSENRSTVDDVNETFKTTLCYLADCPGPFEKSIF